MSSDLKKYEFGDGKPPPSLGPAPGKSCLIRPMAGWLEIQGRAKLLQDLEFDRAKPQSAGMLSANLATSLGPWRNIFTPNRP